MASGQAPVPRLAVGAQMLPPTWDRTGLGWSREILLLLVSPGNFCSAGLSSATTLALALTYAKKGPGLRETWILNAAPARSCLVHFWALWPQPSPPPLPSLSLEAQEWSVSGAESWQGKMPEEPAFTRCHSLNVDFKGQLGPLLAVCSWASLTNLVLPLFSSPGGDLYWSPCKDPGEYCGFWVSFSPHCTLLLGETWTRMTSQSSAITVQFMRIKWSKGQTPSSTASQLDVFHSSRFSKAESFWCGQWVHFPNENHQVRLLVWLFGFVLITWNRFWIHFMYTQVVIKLSSAACEVRLIIKPKFHSKPISKKGGRSLQAAQDGVRGLATVRLWSKQRVWVWRPLSGRVSRPDYSGEVITGFGLWNLPLAEPQLSFHLFSVLVHSYCLWCTFAGCSQGPTEWLSSSGSPPLRAYAYLLPIFSGICLFAWATVVFQKISC